MLPPAPGGSTLYRGGTLIPMDGSPDAPCGALRRADLRVVGGRIDEIGTLTPKAGEEIVDLDGLTVLPGFVQGHVHFCQTLFRGLADDRPLLRWLRERIFPLEAAHDAASTRVSAELTIAELLRGGTTCVQAIESVRHSEQAFEVARAAGIAARIGNCLMDEAGDGLPAGFAASPAESLRISDELRTQYDGVGRLRYAVSPRFVLSVSDALARDAAAFAEQHGLRVHTHASEHADEVVAVRARFGRAYLRVLADQGLLGPRTGLAHCVHLDEDELRLLVDSGASVLHCPSANLKLGSGIASVARFRALGVPLALGADGAACNNRLSALVELRQAALLQALVAGPGAWPAAQALWSATRGAALAIGENEVGALAPGLRADFSVFDLRDPRLGCGDDPIGQLVWTATEAELRSVVVDGVVRVADGRVRDLDVAELADRARAELGRLLARAGLAR